MAQNLDGNPGMAAMDAPPFATDVFPGVATEGPRRRRLSPGARRGRSPRLARARHSERADGFRVYLVLFVIGSAGCALAGCARAMIHLDIGSATRRDSPAVSRSICALVSNSVCLGRISRFSAKSSSTGMALRGTAG
jgi:hypothetical protein